MCLLNEKRNIMKIAVTGGSGFVGRHLIEQLKGHEIVSVSRQTGYYVNSLPSMVEAFEGVDIVVHCAGINREIGEQTYEKVHVDGTYNVVSAAKRAKVKKIVMVSFLRARPDCGSPYHESKWEAEEMIRKSGIPYTIVKAGMVYGKGDHLIDHLSHTVQTLPLFASVGLKEKSIRPLPIEEMVAILKAATYGRMDNKTVYAVGAEELLLSEAVKRVGKVWNRKVFVFPAPVWFHYMLGQVTEWFMKVPLVAKSQVRMLSEGVSKPATSCASVAKEVEPKLMFNEEQIRKSLPEKGGFTLHDLRMFKK